MGGGDLNLKKSWHPGTFKNMEAVWIAEQRLLDEKRKTEQLRKELEEERKKLEYRKLQEDAGLIKKRPERLEWIYSGQAAGPHTLEEDYLLGKKRVDEAVETAPPLGQLQNVAGALLLNTNVNADKDMEAKIRQDPLFAIKRKEQEALKNLMNNPLKMKQLRKNEEKEKSPERSSRSESNDISSDDYNRRNDSRRESRDQREVASHSRERRLSHSRERRKRSRSREIRRSSRERRSSPSREKRRSPARERRRSRSRENYSRHQRDRVSKRSRSREIGESKRILSKEERLEKLEAMKNMAKEHDSTRRSRVHSYNAQEKEESRNGKFLEQAGKQVFSTSTSMTLEERLTRNRALVKNE